MRSCQELSYAFTHGWKIINYRIKQLKNLIWYNIRRRFLRYHHRASHPRLCWLPFCNFYQRHKTPMTPTVHDVLQIMSNLIRRGSPIDCIWDTTAEIWHQVSCGDLQLAAKDTSKYFDSRWKNQLGPQQKRTGSNAVSVRSQAWILCHHDSAKIDVGYCPQR